MKDIQLYEKVPLLKNNFSVKFMEFSDSHYLTPHWHEHIELIFFLSGKCDFTCNGRTFTAGANDFVVVNSTEVHSFSSEKGVSFFCIIIYPDFFKDVHFNSNTVIENLIHKDSFIRDIIRNMYSEYSNGNKAYDMVLKGMAYQLMAYLVRNFKGVKMSDRESLLHASHLEKLNAVMEYISTHYQEKIKTSDLAKLCYISEGHLCRFFKNTVGKSATDYINEMRVEKAAVMLANTDESVTNIAISVGFDDINYFSRVFKKLKKEAPTIYRKNHQNI